MCRCLCFVFDVPCCFAFGFCFDTLFWCYACCGFWLVFVYALFIFTCGTLNLWFALMKIGMFYWWLLFNFCLVFTYGLMVVNLCCLGFGLTLLVIALSVRSLCYTLLWFSIKFWLFGLFVFVFCCFAMLTVIDCFGCVLYVVCV